VNVAGILERHSCRHDDRLRPPPPHRVWRRLDDPNLVIVANTFDSRQAAEAVMNSATLREAMGRGGVIQSSVRIDYVDEVAAGRANGLPKASSL
jgi:hypothetical protein